MPSTCVQCSGWNMEDLKGNVYCSECGFPEAEAKVELNKPWRKASRKEAAPSTSPYHSSGIESPRAVVVPDVADDTGVTANTLPFRSRR